MAGPGSGLSWCWRAASQAVRSGANDIRLFQDGPHIGTRRGAIAILQWGAISGVSGVFVMNPTNMVLIDSRGSKLERTYADVRTNIEMYKEMLPSGPLSPVDENVINFLARSSNEQLVHHSSTGRSPCFIAVGDVQSLLAGKPVVYAVLKSLLDDALHGVAETLPDGRRTMRILPAAGSSSYAYYSRGSTQGRG